MFKMLRRLHWRAQQDPVEEEYRGWNWDRPPVRPRAYLNLGVSEISSKYCETRRDIWLKRVARLKPEIHPEPLRIGWVVHTVFHTVFEEATKLVVKNMPAWEVYEKLAERGKRTLRKIGVRVDSEEWWALNMYKSLALTLSADSETSKVLHGGSPSTRWLPWPTEYRVDGSTIGLSKTLRIDAIAEGGVLVEVKYGRNIEFHKLTLAGYSLALESNLEIPFDYGVIVYVNGIPRKQLKISFEPVYISTNLRSWFLDERDEIIDMLLSEREPLKPTTCPATCPYREVCIR